MSELKWIGCRVRLRTALGIEELGALISARVFGGVPFGGREDFIRDEVPAIYTSEPILGVRFILSGEGDSEGYLLEPHVEGDLLIQAGREAVEFVDLGPVIALTLQEAAEVTCETLPLHPQ
ncbi:MAG TPA: hypothetical protein DCM86_12940 [Verrucomicrobiales bacterium]|nr:hypothetical protein [Verrucomicrobiales bacterium]